MIRGAHLVLRVQGEKKSNGQGGLVKGAFQHGMKLPRIPFLDEKFVWREHLRNIREEAAARQPNAAAFATRLFMDNVPLPGGAGVAIYHPINDELETAPLATALIENGFDLALPITPKGRKPLSFRGYAPGDPLHEARYGVMEPADGAPAIVPMVVVAPLLGFSREGGRLGYGGGYYDRTLEALRRQGDVLAVGWGYAAQEVDALPAGPLDQPLDWIVTEREAIDVAQRFGSG